MYHLLLHCKAARTYGVHISLCLSELGVAGSCSLCMPLQGAIKLGELSATFDIEDEQMSIANSNFYPDFTLGASTQRGIVLLRHHFHHTPAPIPV